MSYINLKNIGLNYQKFSALQGINLELDYGAYTLFLGPNGSGKSSLFSILTTSRAASQGQILINDQTLKGKNLKTYRSNIGVCFQSPSLDKMLSVEENLVCHARLFGLKKKTIQKKITTLIDYFDLGSKVDQAVSTLSGGMQRKVEIIKALLPDVKYLFLDEPSTGLDPSARRDLWIALKKIKQDGIGICMTSHIVEDLEGVDHCYFLNHGKIFLKGHPNQLIQQLGQQIVEVKSHHIESIKHALKEIFSEETLFYEDHAVSICGQDDRTLQKINNLNLQGVESLSLRSPNLMDVYHYHLNRA